MSDNALKNDQEKPRMELVPAGATLEIAKVLTFGAKKYAAHNWRKGFDYSRLIGALERHIAAFKEGEDTDPESGLPHMAHAGCCVMFLLEHQLKGYGKDDRYKEKKNVPIIEELPWRQFLVDTSKLLSGSKVYGYSYKVEYDFPMGRVYVLPLSAKLQDFNFNALKGTYNGKGLYEGLLGRSSTIEVFATWPRDDELNAANV